MLKYIKKPAQNKDLPDSDNKKKALEQKLE
jgi:hypothetical protein